MHYFLLGPSGVGKTTFGDWLGAKRKYLHIPIDRGDDVDGFTAEGLLDPWNQLRQGNPASFVRALDERAEAASSVGCVLTFWSTWVLVPDAIAYFSKNNIAVRYLYGPKGLCINASISREAKNNHPERDRAYWRRYNEGYYEKMGSPDLRPYRVEVFETSGRRLSQEEIAERLKIK